MAHILTVSQSQILIEMAYVQRLSELLIAIRS